MDLNVKVLVDDSQVNLLLKKLKTVDNKIIATQKKVGKLSVPKKASSTKSKDIITAPKTAIPDLSKVSDLLGDIGGKAGMLGRVGGAFSSIGSSALASIGPIGLVVAGIVAVGKTVYNLSDAYVANAAFAKKAFGDTSDSTIILSERLKRLTEDFNENDLIGASRALRREFGLTGDEAAKILSIGVSRGLTSEGMNQLNEYASQMKKAGYDVYDAVGIITAAQNKGFLTDKAPDVIKESTLRLGEMNTATTDALKAVGINGKKLQKAVATGAITQADAIKLISDKMVKFGEKSIKTQTLLRDVFGSPGEDVSFSFFDMLAKGNNDLREMSILLTESQIKSEVMSSEWDALQMSIGKKFSPMIQSITDGMNTMLSNLFRGLRYFTEVTSTKINLFIVKYIKIPFADLMHSMYQGIVKLVGLIPREFRSNEIELVYQAARKLEELSYKHQLNKRQQYLDTRAELKQGIKDYEAQTKAIDEIRKKNQQSEDLDKKKKDQKGVKDIKGIIDKQTVSPDDGKSKIKGGISGVKNITINIGNQIGEMTINEAQDVDKVKTTLITLLNDVILNAGIF